MDAQWRHHLSTKVVNTAYPHASLQAARYADCLKQDERSKVLLKLKFLQKYTVHPISKPWDFVFSKKQPYWIIVHLSDGRRIGGRFGENSFAS
jgi:hypothetical protein